MNTPLTLQIVAIAPYLVSTNFLMCRKFRWKIALILLSGIGLDIAVLFTMSSSGAPSEGLPFLLHVILATVGFFGYIALLIALVVVILSKEHHYYLRKFLEKWAFPIFLCWMVGVCFAFANFLE